ncbi:MAG: hypothetical protein NUV50_02690 [Rhodospirillales bacterium]|nr:hypothetical protein [Rhodospirillales bacterium]
MILKSSKAWLKGLASAAALLALGACAASQSTVDNPILRKFQWFSYLEGGDFKQTCTPGAPGRYRVVYNAVYTEQVRVYDLDAASGVLDARLILPVDLRNFEVEGVSDLLNPWRGKQATRKLAPAEVEAIVAALDADGAFGPPAVGTDLPSMGFFWTIASCHEGAYHFTGLAWPSVAWNGTRFDDALFAFDPIADAVNPPRKTNLWRDKRRGHFEDPQKQNEFIIKVGEDGLAEF